MNKSVQWEGWRGPDWVSIDQKWPVEFNTTYRSGWIQSAWHTLSCQMMEQGKKKKKKRRSCKQIQAPDVAQGKSPAWNPCSCGSGTMLGEYIWIFLFFLGWWQLHKDTSAHIILYVLCMLPPVNRAPPPPLKEKKKAAAVVGTMPLTNAATQRIHVCVFFFFPTTVGFLRLPPNPVS